MEDSIIFKSVSEERLIEIVREATASGVKSAMEQRNEHRYISRKEFSKSRGMSLPTIDKAIRRGELQSIRLGGRVLIVDK
jgi:predicted DNA-binding transcriptional regulator AlpA